MNTMLRYAQKEINRLKHRESDKEGAVIELILDFSRCEDDVTRLAGYKYFQEQLTLLPLPHTEESIKKACELSHFDYRYFSSGFSEETENITMQIQCTKEQARILKYR